MKNSKYISTIYKCIKSLICYKHDIWKNKWENKIYKIMKNIKLISTFYTCIKSLICH